MSEVAQLIEAAMKEAAPPLGKLSLALVQRRASRRLLEWAAKQYRRAADLLDQAALLLPAPTQEEAPPDE